MGVVRFGRTLPLLLIVIGLVKIFQSTAGPGPTVGPPTGVVTGEVQPQSYPDVKPEVKNG
jgi:hypothetical protein